MMLAGTPNVSTCSGAEDEAAAAAWLAKEDEEEFLFI